jgi:hypothetical protein
MSQAPSLMAPVAETLREHASVKPRYGFSKSACQVPAIMGWEQAGTSTAGGGDWAERPTARGPIPAMRRLRRVTRAPWSLPPCHLESTLVRPARFRHLAPGQSKSPTTPNQCFVLRRALRWRGRKVFCTAAPCCLPEHLLLFCVASGTDWQKAGVTGAATTACTRCRRRRPADGRAEKGRPRMGHFRGLRRQPAGVVQCSLRLLGQARGWQLVQCPRQFP